MAMSASIFAQPISIGSRTSCTPESPPTKPAQLKAHLAADGYDTVQDWLTDVVRGYISKGDRE